MEKQKTLLSSSSIIAIVLGVIVLILGGSTWFMWQKLNEVQARVPIDEETELANTISAVGKMIFLPQNEKPQLVTLSEADLQVVRDQDFFINALPGDKVLIYQGNSKAFIWRPTIKKIIEASIINLPPAN